jgi:hypothetical protein
MFNNNVQGVSGYGGNGGSSSMQEMMQMMMMQRMMSQGQNGEGQNSGMMPPPPFMQNGQGTSDQMNMSPDAMMEMMQQMQGQGQGTDGQNSTDSSMGQMMQQMMQMMQMMQQGQNGQGQNGQRMNPAEMADMMIGQQIGQGVQNGTISQDQLQNLIARKQERDQMMQSTESNGQPDKSKMEELRNFDMQTMQMIQQYEQTKQS